MFTNTVKIPTKNLDSTPKGVEIVSKGFFSSYILVSSKTAKAHALRLLGVAEVGGQHVGSLDHEVSAEILKLI